MNAPSVGRFYVRPIQSRHRRAAQQAKRSLNVASQHLDGACHAGLSGGGESVGISPTDKDCTRSQTERFNDVAAAADATVHQDFN